MNNFVIKGDICYSVNKDQLETKLNHYLVVENGVIKGVFENNDTTYKVLDYSNKLIIPGMVDLHTHAPQYSNCAIGMDVELIEWLNKYTFKEEARYEDLAFANTKYQRFVKELSNSATTSAVIFATIHKDSTLLLMDLLESSGLKAFVGKVNMDRNSTTNLTEKTEESIENTLSWLKECHYQNIKPIITPRFLPCCTDELLFSLGNIASKYDLPIQSHLSENPKEIKWVKELFPDIKSYGMGYEKYKLFNNKTIMAHCIYLEKEEEKLMVERGVFVSHAPSSNLNISSGIAPIRRYLDEGMNVGLSTDVSGGESLSMFRMIRNAIQVSKMYYRLVNNKDKALSFAEGFYIATLGGGKFFKNTGSFLEGYDADILVIDDSKILNEENSLSERLERAIYLELDRDSIVSKFVKGKKIF